MEDKTLLEKALEVENRRKPMNDQELQQKLDLVMAYLAGRITPSQMGKVAKAAVASYSFVGTVIVKAYKAGLIRIEKAQQ